MLVWIQRQWIGSCRSNLNAAYALHKDFCQQSHNAATLTPFLLTCYTRNGWSAEPKSFPTKKFFFQSDVIWNVRCAKHLHLLYRCPILLHRSKHFISHSLLLDRFTLSLYVDQELQRQPRSFLFVRRRGKQKLMTFLLSRVLSLSEHCLLLFVGDNIQNWIRFSSRGNFKASPSYCHASRSEGAKSCGSWLHERWKKIILALVGTPQKPGRAIFKCQTKKAIWIAISSPIASQNFISERVKAI